MTPLGPEMAQLLGAVARIREAMAGSFESAMRLSTASGANPAASPDPVDHVTLHPSGGNVQITSFIAYPSSDQAQSFRGFGMHPFEHVSSTNPTAERFAGILDQDVAFHSPVFVHPVTGRDGVAELLETVHAIFGRPAYRLSLSEGRDTALLFDGEVGGQTLQVAVVIHDGPEGLIQELTVLMRPLPVVRLFGEEGMARLGISAADDTPSMKGSDP